MAIDKVEAVDGERLTPRDKMTMEITEAAKALGIEVPAVEYVSIVMELVRRLGQFPYRPYQQDVMGKSVTVYKAPNERTDVMQENTVSIEQLGEVKNFHSGLVLWNDGVRSGTKPVSLVLCLVRRNPDGPVTNLGYIPTSQYDIAEVPVVVGVGEIDFNCPRKVAYPQSVSPQGRIFIRGTTR